MVAKVLLQFQLARMVEAIFLFKKSRIYSELHHPTMRTYPVSLVISGECKLKSQ